MMHALLATTGTKSTVDTSVASVDLPLTADAAPLLISSDAHLPVSAQLMQHRHIIRTVV
jgi:hypothetical protein